MNAAETSSIEAEVRRRLDAIVDPCSAATGRPVGLVKLGLLKRLDVEPGTGGACVRVWLRLTGPGCLMGPVFVQEAEARLAGLPDVERVDVALDYTLDWEPSDMAAEYVAAIPVPRARRPCVAVPTARPSPPSS